MAGAFSGHLVNSYNANQTTPFTTDRSPILTSGSISFNPQMHGTSNSGNQSMVDTSFSFKSEPSFFDSGLSDATTHKIAALQAKLNQRLGPEYISQRPGPGGGPKLTYAEGWKIINLANEVFGFNGWSSNVISLTTDFIDFNEETRRYTIGVTAIMRVTLRDGVFHEDIGYGILENSKSKGQALDKVCTEYFMIFSCPQTFPSCSAKKRLSRMESNGRCAISETFWEIVSTTSRIRKK
jgi:DNA repair and recombination protein RAD52